MNESPSYRIEISQAILDLLQRKISVYDFSDKLDQIQEKHNYERHVAYLCEMIEEYFDFTRIKTPAEKEQAIAFLIRTLCFLKTDYVLSCRVKRKFLFVNLKALGYFALYIYLVLFTFRYMIFLLPFLFLWDPDNRQYGRILHRPVKLDFLYQPFLSKEDWEAHASLVNLEPVSVYLQIYEDKAFLPHKKDWSFWRGSYLLLPITLFFNILPEPVTYYYRQQENKE